MDEYRTTVRKGKGIINIQTTERNGKVVAVLDVRDSDEIMIITAEGMVIRTPVSTLSTIGRNTQGVRLIRLNETDKVVAVAKLAETPPNGDAGDAYDEGADAADQEA